MTNLVEYAVIDLTTGEIDKDHKFFAPEEVPNASHKGKLWLPFRCAADPSYDPETHRLGEFTVERIGDEIVEHRVAVLMTEDEKEQRRLENLASSDVGAIRIGEDVAIVLIRKGILSVTDLDPQAVSKINTRLVLRNEEPLT